MAARRTQPGRGTPTLFDAAQRSNESLRAGTPLADRMRPSDLNEMVGQAHLIGPGKALARAIAADRMPSMILWGPPGSGKTTLGQIVATRTRATFVPYSAVLGTVPDLRVILQEAKQARSLEGRRTVLFIDEIHRFNKSQQDAFLPYVEDGTVTLIGATTENPSFSVNAALLSRCKVFRLQGLSEEAQVTMLQRALGDPERGLGKTGVKASPEVLLAIARLSDGDARRALNSLDIVVEYMLSEHGAGAEITPDIVAQTHEHRPLLYDKSGEEHYNVVSAFIKSMRGSDPDAAVYWGMRMLEAGDEPLFLLRRMLIFASEDIGNADPRALQVAVAADEAFRRLGMPEGYYPITQAILYLAVAPKSNAVGSAWMAARASIEKRGALPVPMKLRNAATRLMKQEGYGEGYQYAHNHEGHVVAGETYLPEEIADERFYEPTDQGMEKNIGERVRWLRAQRSKDRGQ
jgi:putative ATPase